MTYQPHQSEDLTLKGGAQQLREIATMLRSTRMSMEADAAIQCDQAAAWIERHSRTASDVFAEREPLLDTRGVATDAVSDAGILNALRLALPYVERVAGTSPTQPAGVARQRAAAKDLKVIRAALADGVALPDGGQR